MPIKSNRIPDEQTPPKPPVAKRKKATDKIDSGGTPAPVAKPAREIAAADEFVSEELYSSTTSQSEDQRRGRRGRPQSAKISATKSVYFSDRELLDRFEKLCKKDHTPSSASSVIQQLVAGFVRAAEKSPREEDGTFVHSTIQVQMKVRL